MCSGCQQKNRNFLASEVGVDSGAKLGELYFAFQENPFGILSQCIAICPYEFGLNCGISFIFLLYMNVSTSFTVLQEDQGSDQRLNRIAG